MKRSGRAFAAVLALAVLALAAHGHPARAALAGGVGTRPPALSATSTWTPTQISGCVFWLRASLGITLNGSTVSGWADQSGSGDSNKNAVQATGSLQPTYNASDATYNGHPTMTFSGSDLLRTGSWATSVSQPLTVFVVANTDDSASSNHYFYDNNSGSQCAMFDPTSAVEIYGGATHTIGTTSLNTPTIAWAVYNSTSSYGAVNADTPGASAYAGFDGFTGMTIGNYLGGTTYALHGPFAEVAVWNRTLLTSEIDTINANEGAYYNIAIGP